MVTPMRTLLVRFLLPLSLLPVVAALGCAAKPKTYESKQLLSMSSGWAVVKPGTRILLDGGAAARCEMRVGATAEEAAATGTDLADLAWTRTGKIWEVVDFKATGGAKEPDMVFIGLQEAGGGSEFWVATTARTPPCFFLAD